MWFTKLVSLHVLSVGILSGQGKFILCGGTRGKVSSSVANIMEVAMFMASKLFKVVPSWQ